MRGLLRQLPAVWAERWGRGAPRPPSPVPPPSCPTSAGHVLYRQRRPYVVLVTALGLLLMPWEMVHFIWCSVFLRTPW
jgi:hypothetical protein